MDKIKHNSNIKPLIIIIAIVVIAALSVGGVFVYRSFFTDKPASSNGVVGKISDGWNTGLEDKNTSKGSGIQIPGYSTAVMKSGDTSLVLSIGNPEANKCGFYATLMLDDGTVLYESELIKPGCGLKEIPLNKTLEAGEYTAMVIYKCVTLDKEQTPLNSAESEFKLIVD